VRRALSGDQSSLLFDRGFMTFPTGLVDRLRVLLAGERAIVRGTTAIAAQASDFSTRWALHLISVSEAWSCAMLAHHIERGGGRSATRRDPGLDQLAELIFSEISKQQSIDDQLRALFRAQHWMIGELDRTLADVRDPALRRDLQEIRKSHETCKADWRTLTGLEEKAQ
jgi:hypothetical protein